MKSTSIAQSFSHTAQIQAISSNTSIELKQQYDVSHTAKQSQDEVVNFEDDELRDMLTTPGKSDIMDSKAGIFTFDSVTIRNESAWDADGDPNLDNSQSKSSTTAIVGDEKVWEKMASELQAKQARENQRKEEVIDKIFL